MSAKKIGEGKNERLVNCPPECKTGKHDFMVTNWNTGGSQRKAVHVRCRYCLVQLDLVQIDNYARANLES